MSGSPRPNRSVREQIQDFFLRHPDWVPQPGTLSDQPAARRLFQQMDWVAREDLYSYQHTLEGKGGTQVHVEGKDYLMFSSNDYLGYIGHPDIEKAAVEAIRQYGTSTGGVRLLTGTNQLHRALEEELAAWLRKEAAITFSSGYTANIAALSTLLNKRDLVLADAHIHRGLIEALQLHNIPYQFFDHNKIKSLEEKLQQTKARRKLILVEAIYSRDGDLCPLPELVYLKNKYQAFLMVDEAHSIGTLGRAGEGITGHFGIPPYKVDLITGSLSKAIPSSGGFVAASESIILLLQHNASPYLFSNAGTPPTTAAALKGIQIARQDATARQKLWENLDFLKRQLKKIGVKTPKSLSPILPLHIGSDTKTHIAAAGLKKEGLLVAPIVFPAVGRNESRLRLCVSAAHTTEQLQQLVDALEGLIRKKILPE
ncbi:MAG: pyridoxal phosphate-dependent aminotransferase family protein [Phaeodactylibacter sp.]|nr:pyridoxal phosphate-dependent aminotransferase family protein [Phaeodactylibacter sp.]